MDLSANKNKGFTLIELIISIFILSVAVIGIFNAFSIMDVLASNSSNRITATYLAQEGMEIIRNIRDTNWLNMDACSANQNCLSGTYTWVDELASTNSTYSKNCATVGSLGCEADYTTSSPDSDGNALSPVIPYSASDYLNMDKNGFYSYSSCDPSDPRYAKNQKYCASTFQRKILIDPVTDGDGDGNHIIKVTVLVAWNEKATILKGSESASYGIANCGSSGVDNCISAEEVLYNWYNFNKQ